MSDIDPLRVVPGRASAVKICGAQVCHTFHIGLPIVTPHGAEVGMFA